MSSNEDRPPLSLVVAGGAVTVVVLTGVWIALAGEFDLQDLVGGVGAAASAALIGYLVSQNGSALPSLRRADVRQILATPKQIVVETAQVFAVVARKALRRPVTGGSWVHERVDAGGGGWQAARRDSVITALLSVAPGSIVVDIDTESGVALVHRLGGERQPVDPP